VARSLLVTATMALALAGGWLWPVAAVAQAPPAERGADDPVFVSWLDPEDPGDQTIRDYWERAKREELTALELVDLGTMLFQRGWPKDAVHCFRAALDLDKKLPEAWFRIGLVLHREGQLDDARLAYKKCLKHRVGHGWCNFYLGLLEEQTGHPSQALEHYRRAYQSAPELADPKINPEVLSSKLQLGAQLVHGEQARFTGALPMAFVEPEQVAAVRARFEAAPAAGEPVAAPAQPGAVEKTPTPVAPVAQEVVAPPPEVPADAPFGVSGGRVRSGSGPAPPPAGQPTPAPTSQPPP
jgi:tetratricopeptide (TPR) repeat protein